MMSHGQGPIFHSNYCYNHHLVKGQIIDVHNILIKRSRTRVFLSYIGTAAFLTSTLYSLVFKELCMSSISSILLGVAFAKFLNYSPVKKGWDSQFSRLDPKYQEIPIKIRQAESVVIIPEFGIQLETHYWSGKVDHRFVPISMILKPVLNECVTPVTCYWSLALIIRDKDDLLLAFQKMRPPLKMLIPVWKALCNATYYKVAPLELSSSHSNTTNG